MYTSRTLWILLYLNRYLCKLFYYTDTPLNMILVCRVTTRSSWTTELYIWLQAKFIALHYKKNEEELNLLVLPKIGTSYRNTTLADPKDGHNDAKGREGDSQGRMLMPVIWPALHIYFPTLSLTSVLMVDHCNNSISYWTVERMKVRDEDGKKCSSVSGGMESSYAISCMP